MKTRKNLVKAVLSDFVSNLRDSHSLTQEKMAENLRISPRAYSDLEKGKYCFSTVTLLFLLLFLKEEELKMLLNTFREKIFESENKEAA